jgi:small GTP-binding protein
VIQKKICLLGAFAVGKTSLMRRYVTSLFSEQYLSTVGVKVDKKMVTMTNGDLVKLMLWDLAGEDVFNRINLAYLQGMAGYLLVMDGTRLHTFETGLEILQRCQQQFPQAQRQIAINKVDLQAQWEITTDHIALLEEQGLTVHLTSAKTNEAVETAFLNLAMTP